MSRRKQFEFEGLGRPALVFGGSLLRGNPKTKRPLDSKLPILLTLRAVKSGMRLPKTFALVDAAVDRCARKYGVKIYQYANVGNHLHMLVKIPRRSAWGGFIRELTGEIALQLKAILGIKNKFWLYRPHTRVVPGWRKAYQTAKMYVYLNIIEAEGYIKRSEIKFLKDLRALFAGT